jgi:hypothetical protein
MKQTAVEWLFQKLWDEPKDKLTWYAMLKQAQAMFEEQIIDACNQIDVIGPEHQQPGEQYFNKTFNTKEK